MKEVLRLWRMDSDGERIRGRWEGGGRSRSELHVSEDGMGGVVARGPGHVTARMGPGSAEIVVFDGGAIAVPASEGPGGEELLRSHVEVQDIGVGEPDLSYQVQGCNDLPIDDGVLDVGCVDGKGVDDNVCHLFPCVVPGAIGEIRRRQSRPILTCSACPQGPLRGRRRKGFA